MGASQFSPSKGLLVVRPLAWLRARRVYLLLVALIQPHQLCCQFELFIALLLLFGGSEHCYKAFQADLIGSVACRVSICFLEIYALLFMSWHPLDGKGRVVALVDHNVWPLDELLLLPAPRLHGVVAHPAPAFLVPRAAAQREANALPSEPSEVFDVHTECTDERYPESKEQETAVYDHVGLLFGVPHPRLLVPVSGSAVVSLTSSHGWLVVSSHRGSKD